MGRVAIAVSWGAAALLTAVVGCSSRSGGEGAADGAAADGAAAASEAESDASPEASSASQCALAGGAGCPTIACFDPSASIAPLAPGASMTISFQTPVPDGLIYPFTSNEPGDSAVAASTAASGA